MENLEVKMLVVVKSEDVTVTPTSDTRYDIVLVEKEGNTGLNVSDISLLCGMCTDEVCLLDLQAREQECSAIGFISKAAAESLEYDYEASGLHDYVASILDDMENEEKMRFGTIETDDGVDNIYKFNGLTIWLNRR